MLEATDASRQSSVCIGASGGICGLYGLMLSSLMKMGNSDAAYYVLKQMVWLLAFGWLVPNVSNAGHVGGFIGGYVGCYILTAILTATLVATLAAILTVTLAVVILEAATLIAATLMAIMAQYVCLSVPSSVRFISVLPIPPIFSSLAIFLAL